MSVFPFLSTDQKMKSKVPILPWFILFSLIGPRRLRQCLHLPIRRSINSDRIGSRFIPVSAHCFFRPRRSLSRRSSTWPGPFWHFWSWFEVRWSSTTFIPAQSAPLLLPPSANLFPIYFNLFRPSSTFLNRPIRSIRAIYMSHSNHSYKKLRQLIKKQFSMAYHGDSSGRWAERCFCTSESFISKSQNQPIKT
jgi:hypothetical protein